MHTPSAAAPELVLVSHLSACLNFRRLVLFTHPTPGPATMSAQALFDFCLSSNVMAAMNEGLAGASFTIAPDANVRRGPSCSAKKYEKPPPEALYPPHTHTHTHHTHHTHTHTHISRAHNLPPWRASTGPGPSAPAPAPAWSMNPICCFSPFVLPFRIGGRGVNAFECSATPCTCAIW